MTLVECHAKHWTRAHAGSGLTGVALSAAVAVAARSSICLRWVRTGPRGRIAGSRAVALILRRAADRICADTGAHLTAVALGARVAVRTTAAVGLTRVRALPGRGGTHPDAVALILSSTHHGAGTDTDPRLTTVDRRARAAIGARRA